MEHVIAEKLSASGPDTTQGIIKLAVLAVGGQGGGVLTNWIVAVAERNGYHAQATSVAGVAQRTGATIYYVEMASRDPDNPERKPVFALSPSPGDVDILIAAEQAEAGRAVMRGFVTPDRTTLIASSHRILAVSEKIVPGDGRADVGTIRGVTRDAARRVIGFDMERIAAETGSVISASLFGALAGSGALPFSRQGYEETITASGRGVKASLTAFAKAFERAESGQEEDAPERGTAAVSAKTPSGPERLVEEWRGLLGRVEAMPTEVRDMALPGLGKVVDFLDPAYGGQYLDVVERALADDAPERHFEFSRQTAKYAANALVYDDIVRVADLKTRASRLARVREEARLRDDQTLETTEYFHPRMAEICGTLPARLGRAVQNRPWLMRSLDRIVDRGRRIRTDGIVGFSMLWAIAGLRRYRRSLLRHEVEMAHMEEWFDLAVRVRGTNYDLGVEVLKTRRLIKGYSDTHERGLSKFDRVLSALPMLEARDDAADWLRRLREAALMDEKGEGLDGAIETVKTLES